jgi:hypothetical protein
MSKLQLTALIVPALSLLACNRDTQTSSVSPAPPPPEDPAPMTPTLTGALVNVDPAAGAANHDKVRQFPEEVRLTPPKSVPLITGFETPVRDAPGGALIAHLDTNGNVLEVARDPTGDHYLVMYIDPHDDVRKLAGWVNKDAVENTMWSETAGAFDSTTRVECLAGTKHLRTDHDFCARTCESDDGCDRGGAQVCDGLAFQIGRGGDLASTRYCTPGAVF